MRMMPLRNRSIAAIDFRRCNRPQGIRAERADEFAP
jgi:hypothetical protein